jgi:hypothetical protein
MRAARRERGAIDKILDKCRFLKFEANLPRIRAKSSRQRERQVQSCLVRFGSKAAKKPSGMTGNGVMFFLLRMAFWLGVVCVFLPSFGTKSDATGTQIDPVEAVTLASAAVSDARGFCERQPQACVAGGKVAVAIGHKAEAGARTLFEFISTKLSEPAAPAEEAELKPAPGQGTLTASDMAPAWRAPVPLPPRREARNNRPSA